VWPGGPKPDAYSQYAPARGRCDRRRPPDSCCLLEPSDCNADPPCIAVCKPHPRRGASPGRRPSGNSSHRRCCALHVHKVGAIHSDWIAPGYFSGAAGDAEPHSRAPQVPYPLAAPQGSADRYYAFSAKRLGFVQIGIPFPDRCTGTIPCLSKSSVLSLTITS
jgi:hypothetical protein